MKNCIALIVVAAGLTFSQQAQAQQSMLGRSQYARPQTTMRRAPGQAAARAPVGGGITAAPYGSSKYGYRSINGHLPYNPVGSEYRAPTGHVSSFANFGGYYGGASNIGIYYPAAGQAQRRR